MDKSQENFTEHLFLSYSWNDSELANAIDKQLSDFGFEVKRDIRDIGPWTSIKEFMSLIRNQDYAIIIISPSYLKSPNCMYEVMELLKDSKYKNKILSIVTTDSNIYNPISRAKYIKYWEKETKKLEEAIKPLKLENVTELVMELRKYRSIETTIASFLDLISDKNNPKILDAVEKIKEVVRANKVSIPIDVGNKKLDNIEIKVEACHYAFLKFAALKDVSGTEIEKMIGTKKINDIMKQDAYDLPMLKCEIINHSKQERTIREPMIEGAIIIKNRIVDALGFMIKPAAEKTLEPGARITFTLHGPIVIGVIQALFENKIKNVYVEDSFSFRYYAESKQLKEITEYFRKYCSDITELEERFNRYSI